MSKQNVEKELSKQAFSLYESLCVELGQEFENSHVQVFENEIALCKELAEAGLVNFHEDSCTVTLKKQPTVYTPETEFFVSDDGKAVYTRCKKTTRGREYETDDVMILVFAKNKDQENKVAKEISECIANALNKKYGRSKK